ncbi:hypothetical protein MARGE09_P1414 [Marinagarivorans cellulosilyticus]|uniref:CAAX prenyl protease 2/Lysostaphin resistance protein A-like domain-containing protein n=2 Tax=Marinagarivorans cellulosilyticus TaxID=2721545 RepID=A0AAN1WGM9_9GAMM|nr:hypothetical protein MARGE09_P1414 [Marinagarivorans cellulosilyticus]
MATMSFDREHGLALLFAAVLLAEILLISQTVDAYQLVMNGRAQGLLAAFGYLGQVAKWLVLSAVIAGLLLQSRWQAYFQRASAQFCWRRCMTIGGVHAVCYGFLFYLSWLIFGGTTAQAQSLGLVPLIAWLLAACATFVSWLLMLVSAQEVKRFVWREGVMLVAALLIAAVVWWLATLSANLWGPMADATFSLAAFWLQLLGAADIYIDPADKIMGAGDFFVHVANACSGYEGIGLVLAFTSVYLWVHRQEFRFPQALLLFPLGALCIWLLNSLRISLLVLLGAYVSPDVAVGGFHSQAGWLSFIATSVGLLWLAGKITFFNQSDVPVPASQAAIPPNNTNSEQAVATLIPVVVLLAATLVTSSLSAGFDYLYPIRLCAVLVALCWVWRALALPKLTLSWLPVLAGLVVAVLWGVMLGDTSVGDKRVQDGLDGLSPALALAWLACRFVGSVVTVPIAEELAFRGYLLCKFSRSESYVTGPIPFVLTGMAISSLAFGALHGAWLAGTVAGLFYGLVRWRSDSIWPSIVAHSVTNAALFIFAVAAGRWGLL